MKHLLTCLLFFAATAMHAQSTPLVFPLTADSAARVQVFLPARPSGRAVVACPGGGYSHLAMQHEGTDWAPFFNDLGITYAVLTYRMPKGDRTIPMSDAEAAIRLVRDHAAEWHVNAGDVGIMGSSAGGHLASTIAIHADSTARPNFQILFYPVISMDEHVTHKGSVAGFLGQARSDTALVAQYSNERQVNASTPRAIIMLSSDDHAVPPLTNGVAYYRALVECQVPATLHCYPVGGHGWGFRSTFKYHQQMLQELKAWLLEK